MLEPSSIPKPTRNADGSLTAPPEFENLNERRIELINRQFGQGDQTPLSTEELQELHQLQRCAEQYRDLHCPRPPPSLDKSTFD